MRPVYLIGTGQTPVGEHWGRGIVSLAREALTGALAAAQGRQPDVLYVGNALGGELAGQSNLGALLGLPGSEALRVEAAEASGGAALRQGYLAIASGAAELVAVVGVEKSSDLLEGRVEAALAQGLDGDFEAAHGLTRAGGWALLMRRYLHAYGYDPEALAAFPINAHANAASNPAALYRFPIALERYRTAAPVAEPINLLDTPTVADGAAALLLASEGLARELAQRPLVEIAGSALRTDALPLSRRGDLLWLRAVEAAVGAALAQAGINAGDIDVLEVSDPHGIAAALALESAGLMERGGAAAFAAEGGIRPAGRLPLATGGGCKARGDVLGATGVYQIVELARQLRGEAGAAQVPEATTALAICMGGLGATAAAHVLRIEGGR